MAPSSTDPILAHSLWLQRRSARLRARGARWRSDWAPLGILVLLVGILTLFLFFLPSNDAVERAKEAAHHAIGQQPQPPMIGALAEP
jgi:hypothetical protein